jgi:hypothetical protein
MTMTSITFFEYRKKSEIIQLVEKNFSRTKVGELPCIAKVYCSINNMLKLMSLIGYVEETLFERMYERITHLFEDFSANFSSQSLVVFFKHEIQMLHL